MKLRIVSAYFLHGGYADEHVQSMYDTLHQICQEAHAARMMAVIGADCNARVGQRSPDDA
eukprot:1408152-Pyramimonas_sp.AAC.1